MSEFDDLASLAATPAPLALSPSERADAVLFDPQLRGDLLSAVTRGVPPLVALRAIGVRRSAVARWRDQAQAGIEPQASFLDALGGAQSVWERETVLTLNSHAKTDWRAAAHMLARAVPERWGDQPQRVEVDVRGGGIDVRALSDEDLAVLEAIRLRAGKRAASEVADVEVVSSEEK